MNRIAATDYHDLVKPTDPQLAPDGEAVAFVRQTPRSETEYERTIYRASLGGDAIERLTIAEGADSEPRYSPSGDRLAFVSTRGADDDRPQLWIMPTGGGEARQVTDVIGGVSAIAWSPDGSRLAFTQRTTPEERDDGSDLTLANAADDEDPVEREEPDPRVIDRLIYRADKEYFDGTRSQVYVVDLETDEVDRITDSEYDYLTPEWGNASTLYYAVKRTGEPDDNIRYDVCAYDTEEDEEDTLFRTTSWQPTLAATEDGRVAYTYTPEEQASMRQTELEVYDRDTETTVRVTDGLDRTVGRDSDPEWDPAEEELYFLTPDEGDVVLRRVAGDGSDDPAVVVEDGHLTGLSIGTDAVALTKSEWDHPGDVFVTTRGGAETNRLTRINRDYLDDRPVCQPEEISFEAPDGTELQGWVLTPPDFDPEGTYPLAVEIHGGPHAMWSTSGTMWHEFQLLAARGYVVFWSNPRGSTGYGEEFAMAIERDWGEVTMTDVMAGVERVAERSYVDADNLFVTGGSFGGYMTGWIVGHTDRFDGAVAQRGVYDLASFYGSTDAFKLIEWDYDTVPWEEPSLLWEQSPVATADAVTTPTLIVHAENDFRVPVNNGEMFYLFLKKTGVDTRFVRYPREGHELSRSGEPGHVVDRLERIGRWFDGYSDHHDVPRALERGDEGLSNGANTNEKADANGS
ncbi:MAG: S9 family peptidase [Halobacteriales archaeon]|nr:S9 family peptidase [Halobacteriales archaeon]